MVRSAAVLVGLMSVLTLSACFGSTEPATDVKYYSATLNARGTANNGPATSYFEYWQDGFPRRVAYAGETTWPSGASGPFSATTRPIYARTTYHFRMCGHDSGGATVCAQTRSFTTPAPTRDAVKGMWFAFSEDFAPFGKIDATAGATSADPPSGSLEYKPEGDSGRKRFIGFVTCLVVNGERAAVGAVGHFTDGFAGTTRPATALASIDEQEPEFSDRIDVSVSIDGSRPDCAQAQPPDQFDSVNSNDLTVYDAP